jgi:murein DD-endopeptidase MepM/ murein hydrolase activator NlpD
MSSSTTNDPHLPHAVLADAGAGRQLHLHVAPVVEGGRFVSGFGWRRHPLGGGGAYHRGLDIAARSGTPVRAAASGVVVEVGRRGAFGRMVRIRHSVGLETLYAHLSRYAGHLASGRKVRQDEVIGYVGASGRASGPHLHFEVRRNGVALDPLSLSPLPHGG